MRSPILLSALLVIALKSASQTAGNGLSTSNNEVQLGGSLIKTTTIDQNGFDLHLRSGNTPLFSTLANGNVGIGTQTPAARLGFLDVHLSNDPIGISWYNGVNSGDGTLYGIHRTAGPWVGPDYAQLRLGWLTGIVLDPGVSYGKSYVDIRGNGLRVTQGNVGIGTTTPQTLLSLGSTTANSKLALWEHEINGTYYRCGIGVMPGQFRFFVPGASGQRFSFLSAEEGGTEVMSVLAEGNVGIGAVNPTAALTIERNDLNGQTNAPAIAIKNTSATQPAGNGYNLAGVDFFTGNNAVLGQCYSNYGVGSAAPWNSGSGFYVTTRTEHPIIFITGSASSEKARIGANGNFLIGSATDNGNKLQVNGNEWVSGRLEAGSASYDMNPHSATVWDTYNTRFNGGNVSIFSRGNTTITGESFQLNFYAKYHDGGQGDITSKASYINGTVTTVRNSEAEPWRGLGTLVLGSTNTNYSPATSFTDVPAMYVTNGQVGIGVTTPQSQLHTNGTVRFAGLTNDNTKDRVIVSDANGNLNYRDAATLGGSGTAGWGFGGNLIGSNSPKLGTTDGSPLQIITSGEERIHVSAIGNVGIGTNKTTDYKLSVEGNIRARKVRVDPGTWADYVFESDYRLRSLEEVERYIQKEKHLPDVPSAAEVKKEGLDVGDNQAILLKKIEELTLYVIEQNKRIDEQQKILKQQQQEINTLKQKSGR